MKLQHNHEPMTSELTQILAEYEVIPANFGWHIHKGDTYLGLLQYQAVKGWQGGAFTHLPVEIKEQLKKFRQSNSSVLKVAA